MKSLHTLLHSFIFAGLALGVAGSTFASEGAGITPTASANAAASAVASQVPAIQAPSKGILSYLGSGLWYAVTHPKVTLPALGLAGLYYLYNCRSENKKLSDQPIINAQKETGYLDAGWQSPETPRTEFRYWKIEHGSAQKLAANWRQTYTDLRVDFSDEFRFFDKQKFVEKVKQKIDIEKTMLRAMVYTKMDAIFAQSNILPRIENYRPKAHNPVRVIVDKYLRDQKVDHLYELTEVQFEDLDKKINATASFSLYSLLNTRPWKTFNWHRLYAVPYEADAIEQFWKAYQMMAHLDALQYCLQKALADETLG